MVNQQRLEQIVTDLQARLGSGLLATDIWETATHKSLAALNHQPAAVEVFNTTTARIQETLSTSGFPTLNQYYLMEMTHDQAVLIIRHGEDLMQGLLLDTRATNMGIVLSLGLRTALEGVRAARQA